LNTEHADLLSFKTGFITFKDKTERKPEGKSDKPAEKSDKPAEGAPATTEEESKESKKEDRDDKRPKKNYNPNWKKDKAAEKPSLPNVGDDKSFPKLGWLWLSLKQNQDPQVLEIIKKFSPYYLEKKA